MALTVGGCSSSAPSRERLTDALVTSGMSKAQARCAADKVFKTLNADQRQKLAEQGSGGLDSKTSTKLGQAVAACAQPPAPAGG